jgi:hydrogenase maturation protease
MLVIGVGNEFRQDDGVGLFTARRLRKLLPASVDIMELPGEGTALMEAWAGENSVWIIDAVSSGANPGTIHVFEAIQTIVPASFFRYSCHAFSVAEAIELSRAMGILPDDLTVFGIEGGFFGNGTDMSVEVERALDVVVNRIYTEIVHRLGISAQLQA